MTDNRLRSVAQMLEELEADYCPIVGIGFAQAALKADGDRAEAAREARRCLRATIESNDGLPHPEVRRTIIDARQALLGVEEASA